jgi:hypothetical protein
VPEVFTQTYNVCLPEMRNRTVMQTQIIQVPVVQQQTYSVLVPEVRTRTIYRTQTKIVPETQSCNYTVMVPSQVEETIPHRVCRWQAQTITVPVADCCPDCLERFPAAQAAGDAYSQYCRECVESGLGWLRGK